GARLEHLGEVHAVALAARERADLLLLVGALEVEGAAIGARVDLALAELELVETAGNLLPDGRVAVEGVARLVDIAELHGLADLDGAGIGLVLAGDHAEQRGLAGAVRADHADDAARRQLEGEAVDQQVVAEALGEAFEVDDILAEPLRDRDDDLRGGRRLVVGLREQLFVALVARLGFRLPGLRRGRDPLLLALEGALARGLLAAFLREALLLLLEPGRVVALVRDAAAAIELEDPDGHVVEEVAIVGDDQDGARIVAQMAF